MVDCASSWLPNAQALVTLLVGVGVIAVAFLQWRTNRQKVVLDLFEKRLAVFDEVMGVVGKARKSGKIEGHEMGPLFSAKSRARFLFGDDVRKAIEDLIANMAEGSTVSREQRTLWDSEEERTTSNRDFTRCLMAITRYWDEFPRLCERYMKMDQKAYWFETGGKRPRT